MWRLAQGSLDLNSPYCYLMLSEHFRSTCAVAVEQGELCGFVTGFRVPDEPSTLFIWQITVAPERRGRRIASALLDHLADRPVVPRLRWLEATITPSNDASAATFRRFARSRSAEYAESPLFAAEQFPGGAHEAELRVRIGPF